MKKTIFVTAIILIVIFVIQLIPTANNCTSQLRNREIHVTERTGEIFIENSEIPIDRINKQCYNKRWEKKNKRLKKMEKNRKLKPTNWGQG